MKEAVTEHLGEKDGDAVAREFGDVYPGIPQALDLADGYTVHALHHHDLGVAEVPENLRDQHQVQPGHVAAQLRGVGGLPHQIEFVVQIVVELGHHLAGLEALAVGRQALHPPGHHAHETQVFLDHGQHTRAQHLDRHLALDAMAVPQRGEMHLRNGGAGHRHAVKERENLIHRPPECPFDRGDGDLRVERRHAVLQPGQLVGHIGRQQVAACRKHLAELHENGPQALQRQAQPLAARCIQVASERQDARHRSQPGLLETVQHHGVQAVPEHHPQDGAAPQELLHAPARSEPLFGAEGVEGPDGMGATAEDVRATRVPTNWRSACAARLATCATVWAGASPITRARSSSTSQRT